MSSKNNLFNFNLFGPPHEPTEQEKEEARKLDIWRAEEQAKTERIQKGLEKFKNNLVKKIHLLLREDLDKKFYLDADTQLLVNNINNPQKIVDETLERLLRDAQDNQTYKVSAYQSVHVELRAKRAKMLADIVDRVINRYSGRPRLPSILPFGKSDKEYIPPSPEGDELRKLSKELISKSNGIYNRRPVLDEDKNAVALTLFRMQRIREFLGNMSTVQDKYAYLLKTEKNFLNQIADGFIYNTNNIKVFHADKDFGKQIRSEIELYDRVLEKTPRNFSPPPISVQEDNAKQTKATETLRVKILFFLAVTYKDLQLPPNVTQNHVAKTIKAVFGGDSKDISKTLRAPTQCKDDTQSKRYLLKDLNRVKELLAPLSAKYSKCVENEILSLEQDLSDSESSDYF